jgi:hypothetical protein
MAISVLTKNMSGNTFFYNKEDCPKTALTSFEFRAFYPYGPNIHPELPTQRMPCEADVLDML